MEYIKKQSTPPQNWDIWFTKETGSRSYDYGADNDSLLNLSEIRRFLLDEQNGLCAYCQQLVSIESSSIEHVIPKEFNKEQSTNYYNLVAVCKPQIKDRESGKLHCDKEKGNKLITPLIFASNSNVTAIRNNDYLIAHADGSLASKYSLTDELKKQVDSFIDVLNLNHVALKEKRAKDVLDGLILASKSMQNHHKNTFWKFQFNRILHNRKQPFRQFLLMYIGKKIGLN